ncbi:ROK family transcriptional regulator [Streptomyces ipomoeae]|uniref:ROK family transcriptional regulator n=1 Tax=Streptomyces ipomoeae TaxID=103232 RepID=A0AAE9AWK9_9ACTN|nr:ROK family transcriptional regulator [Streptomyces ipomoeae]TQE17878.1 ROK family transcriptional regulator [Streptomyces ipomoeae]TQE29262.1 ROK family transcriptional regulator [Streptomyces ipomoeae]
MSTTTPPGARTSGDGRREANAAAVLRAVLDHGPVARSGIARLSGLSPAAVSRQCTDLARLGLVREVPHLVAASGVGRPQIPVDLDTEETGPLVAGVHIGVPRTAFGLTDLRGTLLARHDFRYDGVPAAGLADHIGRGLTAFIAEHAPAGRRVLGVGAAIGGWVDPTTATVVRHDALGWHHRPLGAELRRHTGLPVRVDNHARAVARSELLFGRPAARRSLLHLFVGNVVDAALAIAGVVHSGPGSGAGDVAHLPVPDSSTQCPCGRTGCLEATVSDTVLTRRAVELGIVPEPLIGLVVDAAAAGDRRADAMLRERANAVGRATALLLDVLNPDLVVITEQSSLLHSAYLDDIRAAAIERSHVCDDPERILVPHAGPAVLLVAAATIVLNPLFSSPLQAFGNTAAMLPTG